MEQFTAQRTAYSADELWLCEHPPVFTLGLGAKPEHILAKGDIPIVQTARGGQVTYHGPGQLVAYPLINLKRLGIFIKEYVYRLEQATIDTLQHYGIAAERIPGAPGVYVRIAEATSPLEKNRSTPPADAANVVKKASPDFCGMAKIAALGIKVSKGNTYHGLALNVAMDLQPYTNINPCGYEHLVTTDMHTMGACSVVADVSSVLSLQLHKQLT
ncbi:lipoyl(octanoyl) transferase LipB [Lampropedia puyangensis]|uniref:Octanoyltransferase n=1 Tax=Lampropedia puyangensis TaxID=1330072 RepID=A0A4S8FED5_9BURK|nr:lipoyl(octanoyl) transferase LipB [Lampropedia puyangensis]THU05431.1 lipoyl(octanoyl) transferase LipB [Lampropedia puyangensis]